MGDAVLQLVYRGPPLECDRDRVRAHGDDDAPLTKDALLEAVRNARADERRWEEEQRDTVGDGSEFKLVKFYREHIARHQRMSRTPATSTRPRPRRPWTAAGGSPRMTRSRKRARASSPAPRRRSRLSCTRRGSSKSRF